MTRPLVLALSLTFGLPCFASAQPCTGASMCASGFCVDSVCCATACGAGAADCQGCAAVLTGAADGTCAPLLSGSICRAATGACDLAESCNGVSATCPGDGRVPSGAVCRSGFGTCDPSESCDGTSSACPADAFATAGTLCQPGTSECDPDDVCDGLSGSCIPTFASGSTVCGPAPAGICDAPDHCAGASADCTPEYRSGDPCRPSMGPCDLAEVCLGTSPMCPVDTFLSPGIACRASVDLACDPTESCIAGGICPADENTCTPATDAGGSTDAGVLRADASTDAGRPTADAGASAPPGSCACSSRAPVGGSSAGFFCLAALGFGLTRRRPRSAR